MWAAAPKMTACEGLTIASPCLRGRAVLLLRGCARKSCTRGREGLRWHEGEALTRKKPRWAKLKFCAVRRGRNVRQRDDRGRCGRGVGEERDAMGCNWKLGIWEICFGFIYFQINKLFIIKSNQTDRFFGSVWF